MLLAAPGRSPQLEAGIALALRSTSERRSFDYEEALETLLAASQQSDAASEAQFDAALVLEQIPMPHEALAQWKKAAAVEHDSEWGKEAARHLAETERRIDRRSALAAGFANLSQPPKDEDYRIPGALETALNSVAPVWLEDRTNKQAEARLRTLASQLRQQAGDKWLGELLTLAATPEADRAARDLAGAWRANSAGEHLEAGELAQSAERGFAATLTVGLASKITFDIDREWWARACAWLLIVSCGWFLLSVLAVYGPV